MLRLALAVSLGLMLIDGIDAAHAAKNNRDNQRAINAINKKISDIKREMSQLDKAIDARMKELKEEAPKKVDPVLKALKDAETMEAKAKKEMLDRMEVLRATERDLETVTKSMQTGTSSSPAFRQAEIGVAQAEDTLEAIESDLERALRSDATYQSAKKRVASAKLRVEIQESRSRDGDGRPADLIQATNDLLVAESRLKQLKENHFGKNEKYTAAKKNLVDANKKLSAARADAASKLRDKPEFVAAEDKVKAARAAFVEANTALRTASSEKYKHKSQIARMKAEVKKFARETDGLIGRRNFLKNELAKQERYKRNLSRRR